ncbi:cytochrome c biogenesis protein CcdA [Sediminicoccus sp. KRV36]|uniref:cytochrome c biogenesis CcdA family protein n=1 Tax=Sediminicoccus sp. KRV36 TaxID=3133721 RepID=UPI002010970D|nr:cytochrome c biogenesis protein CcdA [Sediminicoccus rosea]UPY35583.1 cytochrome c biogenesis protein CcdA [Sediminicoccus rosea]
MQVGYAAALLGGMLSFLSPCVLPLIIPYLGFLGGVTLRAAPGGPVAEAPDRGRVMAAASFFVLGFATVFTAMGATASLISQLLSDHLDTVAMIAGVVLIAFGLHFAGVFRISFLNYEKRFQPTEKPVSPLGSYVVGLAFAFGWTPCVGPVLAGILTIAAAADSVWEGAALLFAYALGIGVPFLLAAAFVTPFLRFVQRFRRHFRLVEILVGGLLVVTGLMVLTGTFQDIGAFLLDRWPDLGRFG